MVSLEFNIKSNKLGDEGMMIIADAFTGYSCNITHLNISQTAITSQSFARLCFNLRSNHTLLNLIADKNDLHSQLNFHSLA